VKEFRVGGATRLKEHLAGKVGMLRDTLNTHQTYVTTFYVNYKGFESERML
jgi:hypothetical protein